MFAHDKSDPDEELHDAPAEKRALVSAIFGAVAAFPKPAEEKLKAVIRAGKIAEAFLACANTANTESPSLEPEPDAASPGRTGESSHRLVLTPPSHTYTLSH